jgi:selenoprotein W-related protein
LVTDLLKRYEHEIESIALIPAEGGRFEITANGHTLYSKLKTGRHANPGEVTGLLEQYLKKGSV